VEAPKKKEPNKIWFKQLETSEMSGNDVGTSSRTSWKGKILVTVPVNFSFGCYCPDIYSGGKNHIASWAMLRW
jgi:glutaminase